MASIPDDIKAALTNILGKDGSVDDLLLEWYNTALTAPEDSIEDAENEFLLVNGFNSWQELFAASGYSTAQADGMQALWSNMSNLASRLNSTAYSIGDVRYFAGDVHRCVFAGTSDAAEPTIIAPLGAAEVVVNGGFDTDTDWAKGGGTWVIAAGVATHIPGSVAELINSATTTATKSYLTSFGITGRTAGGVFIRLGTQLGTLHQTDGTFVEVVTANATNLSFSPGSPFDGAVDNVSVVEVTKDGTCAWETVGYA